MAELSGIAIRKKKRAPMLTLDSVIIGEEFGLQHDFRGKPGKRQVTVLSKNAWNAACAELGEWLDWTTRRANLLVSEIDLKASQGRILAIGEVELIITQETDPCERMKEAHPGLFDVIANDWRGGVCCQVLKGGEVYLGDKVEFKPGEPESE